MSSQAQICQLQPIPTQQHQNLRENTEIHLNSLYKSNDNTNFPFSKINYYHSLVPSLKDLFRKKRIEFHVGKIRKCSPEKIQTKNSVNSHLFKPYYIEGPQTIICQVPTKEIMKHTMVALFQVHEFYHISHPVISFSEDAIEIVELIKHWKIYNSAMLCRIQSLMTYLIIEWLTSLQVSAQIIRELIIEMELERLAPSRRLFQNCAHQILMKHGFDFSTFVQYYKIAKNTSLSIFIYGINFEYRGVSISAVMLPWGLELADELIKAVYQINPNIAKIGLVGGVGYIGNGVCNVDDTFIPDSLLFGDGKNHHIEQIENCIGLEANTTHFTGHNIVKGSLKSVFPQVGKLSNIAPLRSILHKIDALDMEFEAIYKVVKERSKLGAIYYIMDLPKSGLHLGDTYYNREFLEDLFRTYKRGKHFCFEKTLKFLEEL